MSFLYSHLATDGPGNNPNFLKVQTYESMGIYVCFSNSATSQLTFIPLVDNVSLLNENVHNQVDEDCGGGIDYISFLLTVKTGRNERWSYKLQTVLSLRMRKSVSLQINKLKSDFGLGRERKSYLCHILG